MPRLDLTLSITAVIAICALLSPILTTLINNQHQIKIKQLELNQLEEEKRTAYQRSIFENYLKFAGRSIQYSDNESMKMYGEIYFLAFTYAPASIREKMILVDRLIALADSTAAVIELENLSPLIAEYLKQL